jgi:hypothetical protein
LVWYSCLPRTAFCENALDAASNRIVAMATFTAVARPRVLVTSFRCRCR